MAKNATIRYRPIVMAAMPSSDTAGTGGESGPDAMTVGAVARRANGS